MGFRDLSNLNSAHNGYLQIYLDLGLVGVCLIVLILISGYRNASKAFQHNPEFASLLLACIATATFYSITEAGFRILTPSWIFLLLGVVGSSGVARGLLGDQALRTLVSRPWRSEQGGQSQHGHLERETDLTARRGMTQFEVSRANGVR